MPLRYLSAVVLETGHRSLESQQRFCQALGGCPFALACDEVREAARLYGVVRQHRRRSHRTVFVIDRGGALLHRITWYQPGNIGQFMDIFQALPVVLRRG